MFQHLLAPPGPLQLVHTTDPTLNLQIAQHTLTAAQATPAGRARVALSADLPTLQTAPRIAADSAAVSYLTRNIAFDGHWAGAQCSPCIPPATAGW